MDQSDETLYLTLITHAVTTTHAVNGRQPTLEELPNQFSGMNVRDRASFANGHWAACINSLNLSTKRKSL